MFRNHTKTKVSRKFILSKISPAGVGTGWGLVQVVQAPMQVPAHEVILRGPFLESAWNRSVVVVVVVVGVVVVVVGSLGRLWSTCRLRGIPQTLQK